MEKIIVITDIHANLPALEAVLRTVQDEGYDVLIQTGDVIGIGPFPSEGLDLLLSTPRVEHVKGNHEVSLMDGLPDSQTSVMSANEVQHHLWTHACLTNEHIDAIAGWGFAIRHEYEGVKVAFMHSGLGKSGHDIQGIPKNASASDLDRLFEPCKTDLIFYGHRHEDSDVQGRARYINPGSLGCHPSATARYCIVQFDCGHYEIEHCQIAYDDADLFQAFEERRVPDRNFIYRAFFGGRFS